MKTITEAMKSKAIEIAGTHDTEGKPIKFSHYGKIYAVRKTGTTYIIYDDADGGNAVYFAEIGRFTA